MSKIIDTLIIGIYMLSIAFAGKYSLAYLAHKIQYMALEKVALGLGYLEPIAQRMTGAI